MHSLTAHVSKSEVEEGIYQQWRSGLFRNSHETGGYVAKWSAQAASTPRFHYDMTKPEVEKFHLTPWFNTLPRHKRGHALKCDLANLHELIHAATMNYDSNASLDEWSEKMWMNELVASLETRALVFFALEGAREAHPAKKLWIDQFLTDENRHMFERNPMQLMELITAARIKGMMEPSCRGERRMKAVSDSNALFTKIWERDYQTVEAHMERFQMCSQLDRGTAAEQHIRWLRDRQRDTLTPFAKNAEAFAEAIETRRILKAPEL